MNTLQITCEKCQASCEYDISYYDGTNILSCYSCGTMFTDTALIKAIIKALKDVVV